MLGFKSRNIHRQFKPGAGIDEIGAWNKVKLSLGFEPMLNIVAVFAVGPLKQIECPGANLFGKLLDRLEPRNR